MATIRKNITSKYFNLVKSGRKRFEIRVADFKLREGDTLILAEQDPVTKQYSGREIKKKVGYLRNFKLDDWGQKEEIEEHGLYIIQLED